MDMESTKCMIKFRHLLSNTRTWLACSISTRRRTQTTSTLGSMMMSSSLCLHQTTTREEISRWVLSFQMTLMVKEDPLELHRDLDKLLSNLDKLQDNNSLTLKLQLHKFNTNSQPLDILQLSLAKSTSQCQNHNLSIIKLRLVNSSQALTR